MNRINYNNLKIMKIYKKNQKNLINKKKINKRN